MVCVYGPRCDGKTYETVIYGYTRGIRREMGKNEKILLLLQMVGRQKETKLKVSTDF